MLGAAQTTKHQIITLKTLNYLFALQTCEKLYFIVTKNEWDMCVTSVICPLYKIVIIQSKYDGIKFKQKVPMFNEKINFLCEIIINKPII